MKIPDRRETFICRHCLSTCYHQPIQSGRVESSERKTFNLFKCERCGNLSLATYTWEEGGYMMGDPSVIQIDRYPPAVFREKPKWYEELDSEYKSILGEVYDALDYSLFTLASSGVRTAIDRLLVKSLGDIGGFDQKLKALLVREIISSDEHDLLDAIIDAGSASIHRGFSPDDESIKHIMEISEHIFYELCIRKGKTEKLSKLAKKLKETTPKRGKA